MNRRNIFENDYLIRMLLPFEQAIVAILLNKKAQKAEAALEAIGRASQLILGLNPKLMSLLSDAYLYELLEKDTEQGAIRCLVLAALLKEEADVYRMMGDEDGAVGRWMRSLRIYMDILLERSVPEFGNHPQNLEEIADRLRGFEVASELRRSLVIYFERKTRYAQAEDVLYDMLEQTPDDPGLIEDGIAFYQRLLVQHPARLLSGGLPLNEVQAGLAELMVRQQNDG